MITIPIHPKSIGWLEISAGQSSSFTVNWKKKQKNKLALCTGEVTCWSRKGASLNCFHTVGSLTLSEILLYDWRKVYFKWNDWGQPQTMKEKIRQHTNVCEQWCPNTFGHVVYIMMMMMMGCSDYKLLLQWPKNCLRLKVQTIETELKAKKRNIWPIT